MTNLDRAIALEKEVKDLRDFYRAQGMSEVVRLFSEDFDFLMRQKKIKDYAGELSFEGREIMRGPRKKKPRKKRPPDMFA